MTNEIVIALYRPHEGKTDALEGIVDGHLDVLRAEGLVTDRASMLMQSSDGTILEIFEWMPGAARTAHENAAVMKVWGAMGEVASFVHLKDLAEAGAPFPHFRPMN